MVAAQVIFLAVGLIVLGSAVMVVTTRSLIHAALWLVVTLFGVAALYAILNAGFLAIVQVVIYIGAIAILFIFAVMLTRKDLRDRGAQQNRGWWLERPGGCLELRRAAHHACAAGQGFSAVPANTPAGFDAVAALGNALVQPDAFVLPFEVASVLLLAALIGAVYVAFTRK